MAVHPAIKRWGTKDFGPETVFCFYPETVFGINLGVHLRVFCGGLQAASARTVDFLAMVQSGTRHKAVGLSTRRM